MPHTERAPVGEMERVMDRLGSRGFTREGQLQWAVDFAQTRLEDLSPGRLRDFQLELAVLMMPHAKPGHGRDLLSLEQLQQVQAHWAKYLGEWVTKRQVTLGRYTGDFRIGSVKWQGKAGKGEQTLLDFDLELPAARNPEHMAFQFALLLVPEGHRVKACPAMKSRGKSGDVCGRIFVGRPDQVYCSSLCQNREATRRIRAPGRTGARLTRGRQRGGSR